MWDNDKGFMRDNFEKLNQLLEQEQCEFTGIPDGFFWVNSLTI